MARPLSLNDLPEDIARFAEAQMASGKFASVDEVLRATVDAYRSQQTAAERLRAAWDEGVESLRRDGPQLESDEEFDAFLDDCVSEALRQ
ncbi:MAG TPA: type II toxin-antitoxin system ParD family antitoxin [Polyangiaceae bacterium]